jgi:hypothetical protein
LGGKLGSLIPSTRYIFNPKGLAPLFKPTENNGASPFGLKKIGHFDKFISLVDTNKF